MELHKKCDEGRSHSPFDSERLDRGILRLEALGGERHRVLTEDGHAEVEYMLLTFEKFKKAIESKGGKWESLSVCQLPSQRDALRFLSGGSSPPVHFIFKKEDQDEEEWDMFCEDTLLKMGWKRASVVLPDGKQQEGIVVQQSVDAPGDASDKGCFLRCHSPGQAYAMDLKYIGQHLSLGKDLCLFDYRGTHNSSGIPSEGGYYLDAETVFQKLTQTHGYAANEIWASGFCLGSAVAVYLVAPDLIRFSL